MTEWRTKGDGSVEPAKHQLKGGGKTTPLVDGEPDRLMCSNPDTLGNPGWDRARRARYAWIKSNIRPVIATGDLADEDLAALPPVARTKAKELAAECRRLYDAGEMALARHLAEESGAIIEGMLPADWSPPASEDDPRALAARIGRR